jgi:steroid delta-isomerase-like uncharacterized protein
MSDNKKTIRRYYEEVFNQGRLEVLDEIVVADHLEHNPLPGQTQGIEGIKQRVAMLRAAFNPQFTLEDVLADGDKVVVRWSNKGTHLADFFGVPATGRTVVVSGIDIHQLREGKLAEHWDQVDIFGVMMQIGGIPSPSGATPSGGR